MGASFAKLLLIASGAATLAVFLLVEGLGSGSLLASAAGVLVALVAALGIVALARIVVVLERGRRQG